MISIKKLIDLVPGRSEPPDATLAVVPPGASVAAGVPPASSLLSAYQAALVAMGTHGQRAVPSLGTTIGSDLARISENLNRSSSPESIDHARRAVEEQLTLWADNAQQNQKQSEQTVRDLLMVVFEATESTGTRDEKFMREIGELTDRLRAVAGLENLPLIRRSLTENASALSNCVARMADEGRESIRKLTSEILEYQNRLVASERRALVDPLTGLCNRRGFEEELELRVQSRKPFSLLVADLNSFKDFNDRYGHLVGDEILKHFAGELKAQFRPQDTVARWGGDEFVGIVAGSPKDGALRAERVRLWALGEYKITVNAKTITVKVDAALGTTAWNGAETGMELFARADKEMYRCKQSSKLASRAGRSLHAT